MVTFFRAFVALAILVLLMQSAACAASESEATCAPWDDDYKAVVAAIDTHNESLPPKIRWNPLKSMETARRDVAAGRRATRKALGEAQRKGGDAIRLEIVSSAGYECLWIETRRGGTFIAVYANRSTATRHLSEEDWSVLRRRIARLQGSELHSYAQGVDDGGAYYVSLCLEGQSRQYGLYGLPPKIWHSEVRQMPQSELQVEAERAIAEILEGVLRDMIASTPNDAWVRWE